MTGREAYEELGRREITSYKDIGDLISHMGENKYNNEEATKQGLILPYLKLVGFNYVNVNEIQPEFGITDRGKFKELDEEENDDIKGEIGKLDYLIKIEDDFHLVEAKKLGKSLTKYINQLKKYFDNLEGSKLGILTDGNHYLFFTDMKKEGYMDSRPFLCYGLINNFRNERVEFFSELYKYTRFNNKYITKKINEMNSDYNNKYNYIMKRMNELVKDGVITHKEFKGLSHLMDLKE